jgi:hypothetical protein
MENRGLEDGYRENGLMQMHKENEKKKNKKTKRNKKDV